MHNREDPGERDEIRAILAANIRRLNNRAQNDWDDDLDAAAEQLHLTRLRTLAHLAREYRLLARDEDLNEMEAEVNLIQEARALQKETR